MTQWTVPSGWHVYLHLHVDCISPEAPVYQAASPDEEALVGAARELGWVFLSRTRDFIVVSELGVTRQYQLLALLDFTSQRRRMSVLGESSPLNTHQQHDFDLTISCSLLHSPPFSELILSSLMSVSFPDKLVLFFLSVREPEGGLKLYCKGADIVILERLQKDCPYHERVEKALEVNWSFCWTINVCCYLFYY